jgi:hypothetical protein
VQSFFSADEVFAGRGPNRGTETCAVVEMMASLSFAFSVLGGGKHPEYNNLMDRVERLAFNALPASLTADMWTHVYVQQANSVFAGKSGSLYTIHHTLCTIHHTPHTIRCTHTTLLIQASLAQREKQAAARPDAPSAATRTMGPILSTARTQAGRTRTRTSMGCRTSPAASLTSLRVGLNLPWLRL